MFHWMHGKTRVRVAQSIYCICSLMMDFRAETRLLMVNYKQSCDWLWFWVRFFVEAIT